MIRPLTNYEKLRQKIAKKHSFSLSDVEQVLRSSINSVHTYLAISSLYIYVNYLLQYYTLSQEFARILELIPKQMQTTQLYQLLSLKVWRANSSDVAYKKDCRIVKILAQWMNFYEDTLSKTQHNVFSNLLNFIKLNTRTHSERIIFIEEVYDDLKETVRFFGFWEDPPQGVLEQEIGQLHEQPTYENLKSLVDVLTLIVPKVEIHIEDLGRFYDPLVKYLDNISKYDTFVNRSLKFLLDKDKFLGRYEKQLTLASLVFLQRASKEIIIQIITSLVTKTSKAVRFALAVNYQKLLQVLYKSGKLDAVAQIQNLPQIRQLVMRNIPKNLSYQLQFISNESIAITVSQRQSVTYYFQITKPKSIIILEYILEGDIGVILTFEGNLWEYSNVSYLTQTKSKSKSIQILANNPGLHSLTFSNKYSWLTPKHVKFSLKIFKPYEGYNSEFNILVYPEEFIPWKGYQGVRFDDEEGEFLHIWKSAVGQKSDLIIFQQKCFFGGVIYPLRKLNLSAMQKRDMGKCLIVGQEGEYEELVRELKASNPELKVRYCEYQDI